MATQARHADIDDHTIGSYVENSLETGDAISGGSDLIAANQRQSIRERGDQRRIVVDQ
jgi:hypothetical protein